MGALPLMTQPILGPGSELKSILVAVFGFGCSVSLYLLCGMWLHVACGNRPLRKWRENLILHFLLLLLPFAFVCIWFALQAGDVACVAKQYPALVLILEFVQQPFISSI